MKITFQLEKRAQGIDRIKVTTPKPYAICLKGQGKRRATEQSSSIEVTLGAKHVTHVPSRFEIKPSATPEIRLKQSRVQAEPDWQFGRLKE